MPTHLLIILMGTREDAGSPVFLRTGYERPYCGHDPDQRNKLAAPHSVTSSARGPMDEGTSRPRAFAVLRLITRSKRLCGSSQSPINAAKITSGTGTGCCD